MASFFGKLKRSKTFWILLVLAIWLACVMYYQTHKALPKGLDYAGPIHHVKDIDFLYDLSYKDKAGNYKHDLEIFDHVNKAISDADDYIVIDMFLFNSYYDGKKIYPEVSEKITDSILSRKKEKPNLKVIFITDEVNTTYGSYDAKQLSILKKNGVKIVYSNLDKLRDSNAFYSSIYRTFFQWFDFFKGGKGYIPNPMAKNAPDVTLSSYLDLLNIKANHRKVLVTDKEAMVISANPHDESGFHSNIGFEVKGNIQKDILKAEGAVSRYSDGPKVPTGDQINEKESGDTKIQFLTEKKIFDKLLKEIANIKKGDKVKIGMFYIADRKVVEGLTKAAQRGAEINLVLDPNKTAFGTEKTGLPNVPVTAELQKLGEKNIHIRWYNTTKEQYHTKIIYIKKDTHSIIMGGSANYTQRTLNNYNLESDLWIDTPKDTNLDKEVDAYFETSLE